MTWTGKIDVAPRRVLIVLLGAIGDVARALPLAQRLRAAWPEAHIAWAVEPPAAPLLQGHPALDEVVVFHRGGGVRAFFPFLKAVRRVAPDLTLDLQRHFKSGLTSRWSGAPMRIGFHRKNSREGNWLFHTHCVPPMPYFSPKVRQFLNFGDLIGLPNTAVDFGLRVLPGEDARLDDLLRAAGGAFAALFVGSTWPSRRWLAGATAVLCRGLRERGMTPVLVGGPGDVAFAGEVVSAGAGEAVNCVGRTTLRDVVGILSRASVAVGPDSGPMHIAAAVGTPVISLWGATSPARSAPFGFESLIVQGQAPCVPCYRRTCPIGQLCMESIRPAAVLERVDAVLGKHGCR